MQGADLSDRHLLSCKAAVDMSLEKLHWTKKIWSIENDWIFVSAVAKIVHNQFLKCVVHFPVVHINRISLRERALKDACTSNTI